MKDRLGNSYAFLLEHEERATSFDLQELLDATGWKESTPQTYLTKKWKPFVSKDNEGDYRVTGLSHYSLDEYRRHMSQVAGRDTSPIVDESSDEALPAHVERLVVKARDAAMLALDVYNRPATSFRTEAFSMLMIVAWTSLMHATLLHRKTDIVYRMDGVAEQVDGEDRFWDLGECLRHYHDGANPPSRQNLRFMIGLRNKIEHRYAPAIDAHVAGECQACVLNFDELLVGEFGQHHALRDAISMPLQTANLRTPDQLAVVRRFQGKHYEDIKQYIDDFRESLPEHIYQDPSYSFRVFLVPKVGNHASSSDLSIEFVSATAENKDLLGEVGDTVVGIVREKKVPVANAGRYRASDVAKIVASKLSRKFTTYNHTQAWKKYGIRQSGQNAAACRTKYCQFDDVHGDYVYTDAWIQRLVSDLSDGEKYAELLASPG